MAPSVGRPAFMVRLKPFTGITPFNIPSDERRLCISFVNESASVDARWGGEKAPDVATSAIGQLLPFRGGVIIDTKACQGGFSFESTGAAVTVSGVEVLP